MNSNNIFVQWILFDTIIRIRLSTIVILKIQRNPRLLIIRNEEQSFLSSSSNFSLIRMSLNSRPMIFDPLPFYPRGGRVRFRLYAHTYTARRRRDADEIGISMRVIVGSPGAGQYRVFSSVREHSKHRATMAQNGRQLPDTLLSREPLSLSLSLSIHPSIRLSLFLRWRSTG